VSGARAGTRSAGSGAGLLAGLACAFGFEVRLAAGRHRVDLGVRFGPSPHGRAALAALVDAADDGDPRWERLRRFAAAWGREGTPAHAAVPLVFLEFDASGAGNALPVPSIFAALAPGHARLRTVGELVGLLTGHPLAREARASLAACIEHLPRHSRLLQIGAMVGRRDGPARIFAAIWKRHAAGYLEAVGYPGDADAVLRIHEAHADWCESILLQLDVAPSVGARLGIELDAQAPTEALRAAEWRALTERLVRSDLCTPEHARAVLGWRRPAEAGRLRRDVSHVKIVFDGRAEVEAKAYLFEERRALG
jgi:hypothetical protein